jgi:xanthine dehydrogenase accessory factor
MTEADVYGQISESIRKNIPSALVTVISHAGSTPGKEGSVMAVLSDGRTWGSVGGGDLEYTVIKQAALCIANGIGGEYEYSLNKSGEVNMSCGGSVRIYIRVFSPSARLIIAGGGHIALQLYKLALMQNFSVIIIDHREEFANTDRFPQAAEVITADAAQTLKTLNIDNKTFIAIATHSHETDEAALRAAADSDAAYIGMIGSKKKVAAVFQRMKNDGFSDASLGRLYAPMGLNIATVRPEEIALSIISEIMLVKNSGTAEHMKNIVK